jgi:hypothetical protein
MGGAQPGADRTRQGSMYRNTMLARMDKLFRGRRFDIEKVISLPEGQVFVTALGRPARHGYILRDRATGERIAVGFKMLQHIHELYLGVDMPSRKRERAKKEQHQSP